MIDRELVTRKFRLILQDLARLEPAVGEPVESFLEDEITQTVVERYLERIIGRMIDVNYHLITASGGAPPSDYFQSFTELANFGALPGEWARKLAPCVGVRNRLVHEYDAVDPGRIHEAARSAVSDVPEYLRYVQAWLDR